MENSVTSFLPVWACLASLLAVPLIVLFRKEIFLREAVTFGAGIAKFAFVVAMLPIILDGKVIEYTFVEGIGGINVPILFRVDGLGMIFALVASSLWILTSIYAVGYMRGLQEHSQTRFFAFFALSLCATLGVAFSGNLLTLYLFYELLSLSTWPLVTHHQDKEARTGGRTYLSYLLGTSIAFAIPAIIFTYLKSGGDLSFAGDAILAQSDLGYWPGLILLLGFAFGFSKAGLMPFHSWLPGAMVAPTPVSALLHAVAVVKVGVFCILRVVTGVFGVVLLGKLGINLVLCWVAAFTVIVSSLIALSQDNLKRRLAFSTIGQLSYIVLGAALLTQLSITGSVLHIAAHAVGKITLFFCAGAIYVATGKKYVSELAGLGRTMPITMGAFFVGSLGVIGLPPSLGFISKFHLVVGAADAGQMALLVVFLISTILNAAYFLPIAWQAFFPKAGTVPAELDRPFTWSGVREAPMACVIPLAVTAFLSTALFFCSGFLLELARRFLEGLGI
jgi:multicomponent Na+:H+ antiporter subunit D